LKEFITVTTIGTQYDEDHVVCITEMARDILLDSLYAEINSMRTSIKAFDTPKDAWMVEDDKEKIGIAERLVVQLQDMKVCDD